MNSVEKEMQKRRNRKAKKLKKLRRARDWASPFINRILKLSEVRDRFLKNSDDMFAKSIALEIIDQEDMRRNIPRPPKGRGVKPPTQAVLSSSGHSITKPSYIDNPPMKPVTRKN